MNRSVETSSNIVVARHSAAAECGVVAELGML
jgi:hypothetical protein